MKNQILGPRTSVVPRTPPPERATEPDSAELSQSAAKLWPAPPHWKARASGARLALGSTKEVLGFIIDFLDFKDFLGFPILLLGFPRISIRISIRILSGF